MVGVLESGAVAADRQMKVERWERVAEWPLMTAAVAFLVAYAVPIIHPELSAQWHTVAEDVVTVTWAIFAADYLVRFVLSTPRMRFVRRNLFDLAVVALPLLRPLRLLRLVFVLSVLQRYAAGLRMRTSVYMSGAAALLVLCGGLAITDAERGQPDSNVESVADGLWWAMVSMTTVGYGDIYPTTAEGRLVAVGLMLAGIALLGTVTAMLASWFVERIDALSTNDDKTQSEVAALRAEIVALREAMSEPLSSRGSGRERL